MSQYNIGDKVVPTKHYSKYIFKNSDFVDAKRHMKSVFERDRFFTVVSIDKSGGPIFKDLEQYEPYFDYYDSFVPLGFTETDNEPPGKFNVSDKVIPISNKIHYMTDEYEEIERTSPKREMEAWIEKHGHAIVSEKGDDEYTFTFKAEGISGWLSCRDSQLKPEEPKSEKTIWLCTVVNKYRAPDIYYIKSTEKPTAKEIKKHWLAEDDYNGEYDVHQIDIYNIENCVEEWD